MEDPGSTRAGIVAVFRRRGSPWEMGNFPVDRTCLGVRNAWFEEVEDDEIAGIKDRLFPNDCVEKEAAWGRKFVEGSVEYARRLGFKPTRHYKKAARVFGGVNADSCPETFVYGAEGKTLYVAHPDDTPELAEAIIRQLQAKCGTSDFNYLVEIIEDQLVAQVNSLLERLQAVFPEEAKAGLLQLLEKHPESPTVLSGLGRFFGHQGNTEEALSHMDQALRLNPRMGDTWFNKGVAHQNLFQFGPKVVALRKALELADLDDQYIAKAKEVVELVRQMAKKDCGLDLETYIASEERFTAGSER